MVEFDLETKTKGTMKSSKKKLQFLVVEDDLLSRLGLVQTLKKEGECFEAGTKEEALKFLDSPIPIDIAFVDLDLGDSFCGTEIVSAYSAHGIYCVVLSGHEDEEAIRLSYEKGCRDYLVKPLRALALQSILSKFHLAGQNEILEDFFKRRYLTNDPETMKRLSSLSDILISDRPVLILGETGTGKTLVAKLLHELRFGSSEHFIALNCAEIPENLLESELFGYEKGAFTGAAGAKKGKLLLASGGTLFLDEIATLSIALQKKLLKAIEEKVFYPLGAEKPVESDFHLISATCENLKKLVELKEFREDLYFRIEGFNLTLPPLRERPLDIPLLTDYFLKNLNPCGRRVILDNEVMDTLLKYAWPGNIRELQKIVQIFLASSKGIITQEMLPQELLQRKLEVNRPETEDAIMEEIFKIGMKSYIEALEEKIVSYFLKKNEGQVRLTLKDLKIPNSAYYRISERIKNKGRGNA